MSEIILKCYTLRDLVKIKNGRDHKDLNDGNIPVFGSGGIMRFADKAIYEEESILLPRKGTLSNIQYVNKPFWTVDTIYYTIVNQSIANPYFLYNYIKILDLSGLNSGTGVPSMTFDAYYDLEINLPELKTQSQIAKILSDLDAKIELNNKINAELEGMAKLIYDYWFVQFEFPDENGKPYKSSGGKMVWNEELKREVPKGWELKELCEILKIKYGKDHKKLKDGSIPVYGSGGVMRYVDSFIYSNESILIPRKGSIGNLFYLAEPFWSVDTMFYTISNIPNSTLFFFHQLSKFNLKNLNVGTAVPSLTVEILNKIKLFVPSGDIIERFNATIKSNERKILNNQKQNQKLAELRDWLLPMLMNGQVSVDSKDEYKMKEEMNMAAEATVKYE